MPRYVLLVKLTDQGAKNIKEAPAQIEESTKALEAAGCKMIDHYFVMGEYDAVAIVEAPSDEVVMTQLVGIATLGSIRTTTLKAFTTEEFAEMLKRLP